MASKTYVGPSEGNRIDGSESIERWVRQIAERQTYPAVRRRNAISLDADPVELYFYQKLTSGRRCTCWGKDSSPSSQCRTCFATGIVGGYQKYGTSQIMIDPSYPEIRTVNLQIETSQDGPEAWVLSDNAYSGYLEATVHFQGNFGPLDYQSSLEWIPDGAAVRWYFKLLNASSFVELNTSNFARYLDKPQLFVVKAEIERSGLETDSPVVLNNFLRIHRTPTSEVKIRADRERINKSLPLTELGVLDEWTTAKHFLDHTLPNITSEDWFYNIDERKRWKVIDCSPLAPQGFLLSWDLTCRYVQKDEPLFNYPT